MNTMTNYDSIDEALNTSSAIDVTPTSTPKKVKKTETDDIKKDYDYTRANLYSLIEKGQESLNGVLEVAGETASPRAYEVAGQLIKTVTDTNRDLIDLQKKAKDLFKDDVDPKTINNNLFVGNTSELTKLLGGTARDVPSGKKKL